MARGRRVRTLIVETTNYYKISKNMFLILLITHNDHIEVPIAHDIGAQAPPHPLH